MFDENPKKVMGISRNILENLENFTFFHRFFQNMFGCCTGDRGKGEGYYDDDSDASSCSDASDSRGGFEGISSRREGGRKKGSRPQSTTVNLC